MSMPRRMMTASTATRNHSSDASVDASGPRPSRTDTVPGTDVTRLLEELDLPYATFDVRGRCTGVSAAAFTLLGPGADRVCALAAEALRRSMRNTWAHSGPAVALAPTPDGRCALRAQALSAHGEWRAILVLVLPARAPGPSIDPAWGLSCREREVAALIARGASTRAVAAALGISEHTVRRHTERVFAKLGVTSRVHVVAMLGHRAEAPASRVGEEWGDAPIGLPIGCGHHVPPGAPHLCAPLSPLPGA